MNREVCPASMESNPCSFSGLWLAGLKGNREGRGIWGPANISAEGCHCSSVSGNRTDCLELWGWGRRCCCCFPCPGLGETALKLQQLAQLGFVRSPAFTHDPVVAELSVGKAGSEHLLGRSRLVPCLALEGRHPASMMSLLSAQAGTLVCRFDEHGTPRLKHLCPPISTARRAQPGIWDLKLPGCP